MAVAVKNASEAAQSSPLDRLAVSSLLGVLYVLGSVGIVFYAIPSLWATGIAAAINQSFISAGLQIVAMAAAAVGLLVLGCASRRPQSAARSSCRRWPRRDRPPRHCDVDLVPRGPA